MSENSYPQRKHPRIKNYDYSTPGYYFITIYTYEKACIFGQPLQLNRYGKIAMEGFRQIPNHFAEVRIDKYVVMPNHVHAIIVLPPGTTGLSVIVGSYKSYVSRMIRADNADLNVWQTSFHDHVIRDQRGYERI